MAMLVQDKPVRAATRQDWSSIYAGRLLLTDTLVVFSAVFGSQFVWFGFTESAVSASGKLQSLALSYTVVSAGLSLAWVAFLSAVASRDSRIVGTGTAEYRRVVNSSLMLFGLLGIAAYLLKVELARGYFATALPLGLVALLLSRWLWRRYLTQRRHQGLMSARVVLVGSIESVIHIARELSRHPEAGYFVSAACIPESDDAAALGQVGIEKYGNQHDLIDLLRVTDSDTVVITSSEDLPPRKLRELSWSLEPGRQHLVMAPALTDIAGPRIHTRPVAGLPLVHVETPRYEGSQRAIKRLFDIVGASLLIGALSPLLAVVAIGVRSTSTGPILFRQSRVGLRGERFHIFKFRTMVTDAESQLEDLLAVQGRADRPLFKIRNDPRITRLGLFLRRYSLDELPQLLNVIRGDMSLVGPRPQVPGEVELYDDAAGRRLFVKPGVTGLWQTSGRSNLSWDEAIRLDLYYVENWSLTGDLMILWRTLRAVISHDGAV